MSSFSAIDLSLLPAPDVIEFLSYADSLAALRADLLARAPELAQAMALESEPINKLLEVCAYRETLLRARVNDAAHAVMLAYAVGSDLDHLAAFFGISRLVIQEANPEANPLIPEILESDERLRLRTQLALEGYTTAGPIGAYVFHSLSASLLVKDVHVRSPEPGEVLVTVLSTQADGTPDAGLLATVSAALNAEEVRPLTDLVTVVPATITDYTIVAELLFYAGPDRAVVLEAARAAAQNYADLHHRLGHDITLSGIYAALHQPGVQNVALSIPTADIVVAVGTGSSDTPAEAAYCTAITLTDGGIAL